jgi:hypothetical protein
MKITHYHKLSIDEACKRINNLLPNLQKKHSEIQNSKIKWNSKNTQMEFSVEIMQTVLKGNVNLYGTSVTVEGNIPFKFILFSGAIENMIKQELIKLLS